MTEAKLPSCGWKGRTDICTMGMEIFVSEGHLAMNQILTIVYRPSLHVS